MRLSPVECEIQHGFKRNAFNGDRTHSAGIERIRRGIERIQRGGTHSTGVERIQRGLSLSVDDFWYAQNDVVRNINLGQTRKIYFL